MEKTTESNVNGKMENTLNGKKKTALNEDKDEACAAYRVSHC